MRSFYVILIPNETYIGSIYLKNDTAPYNVPGRKERICHKFLVFIVN